ncbi:hypothetical protein ACFE04_018377 [Oxalis oulophora]
MARTSQQVYVGLLNCLSEQTLLGMKNKEEVYKSGVVVTNQPANEVEEVELLADFQCPDCEKRIIEIMSRYSETESILINVFEKKVALAVRNLPTTSNRQVPTIYRKNILNKMSIIKKIFGKS